MSIRSLAVYCGSQPGARPAYAAAALEFGQLLAQRGIELVYGAGSTGIMGVVANAVLDAGGEVMGVIPRNLFVPEIVHTEVTTFVEAGSMHERKAAMFERADACVALPGGFGTMDELFEVLTWAQIGLHSKPVGLLDVEGYWQPLLRLVEHAVAEGFVRPAHGSLLVVEQDPVRLLERLG